MCANKDQILHFMVSAYDQHLNKCMKEELEQKKLPHNQIKKKIRQITFMTQLVNRVLVELYGDIFNLESQQEIEGIDVLVYKELFFQKISESYIFSVDMKSYFSIHGHMTILMERMYLNQYSEIKRQCLSSFQHFSVKQDLIIVDRNFLSLMLQKLEQVTAGKVFMSKVALIINFMRCLKKQYASYHKFGGEKLKGEGVDLVLDVIQQILHTYIQNPKNVEKFLRLHF